MEAAVVTKRYPSSFADLGKPFVIGRVLSESTSLAVMKFNSERRIGSKKSFREPAPEAPIKIEG
jgi:hypothetical protein